VILRPAGTLTLSQSSGNAQAAKMTKAEVREQQTMDTPKYLVNADLLRQLLQTLLAPELTLVSRDL
jgi:hypothetical protein